MSLKAREAQPPRRLISPAASRGHADIWLGYQSALLIPVRMLLAAVDP
jgi:hypothetical protein